MNARGAMASSMVIRDDRIASVSMADAVPPHSPCARVIDLRGRRVIPGMIDTHDHPSYFTARPGDDVRLDSAASIADVQRLLRARAAAVKPGQWLTSLGGWSVAHLAEKRMPTAAELDAAAPNHPVLLVLAGQGATNSRGKAWFSLDLTPDLPFLRSRLDNQMMGFGNDWVRVGGVGERVAGGDAAGDGEWDADGRPTLQYLTAVQLIAQRGWTLQQHSTALNDARRHVDLWEKVNASVPLAPLRWTLAHVRGIDRATLDRLKALGVGVSIAGSRYMSEGDRPGPPIRTIVQSGIRASYGSDNPTNPPTNPWLHMYAIVTGRNYAGTLIEGDETLSRLDALRLYTINGAWFTRDENTLGSIEVGKLADVVVLSDDFLDPARVPDAAIRRVHSVLTIVGGRIVHDSGQLQ